MITPGEGPSKVTRLTALREETSVPPCQAADTRGPVPGSFNTWARTGARSAGMSGHHTGCSLYV